LRPTFDCRATVEMLPDLRDYGTIVVAFENEEKEIYVAILAGIPHENIISI